MLGRLFKSIIRTAAVTADATSLAECCPARLTNVAAARLLSRVLQHRGKSEEEAQAAGSWKLSRRR